MNSDSDYYDKASALEYLGNLVNKAPSHAAWCQEKGVSPQQLSDLLNGRKTLSGREEGKIFEAMGIKEILAEKRKIARQIVATHRAQCNLLRMIQAKGYIASPDEDKELNATVKRYDALQKKYESLDEQCPIQIYFKWER